MVKAKTFKRAVLSFCLYLKIRLNAKRKSLGSIIRCSLKTKPLQKGTIEKNRKERKKTFFSKYLAQVLFLRNMKNATTD